MAKKDMKYTLCLVLSLVINFLSCSQYESGRATTAPGAIPTSLLTPSISTINYPIDNPEPVNWVDGAVGTSVNFKGSWGAVNNPSITINAGFKLGLLMLEKIKLIKIGTAMALDLSDTHLGPTQQLLGSSPNKHLTLAHPATGPVNKIDIETNLIQWLKDQAYVDNSLLNLDANGMIPPDKIRKKNIYFRYQKVKPGDKSYIVFDELRMLKEYIASKITNSGRIAHFQGDL